MENHMNQTRVLGMLILLTLLLSLLFPTSTAFADDTTPPAEISEVVDVPAEEETLLGEEVTPEAEAPADEEPVVEEPSSEEPAVEEAITEEPTVEEAVAEEPASGGEAQTKPATEADPALAQLPDGMDLVVLDEAGQVVPLATQKAADALVYGDPKWCPDGVTPGNDPADLCTDSFTSFNTVGGVDGLLVANVANKDLHDVTGNGTIYVEAGLVADTSDVVINGNAFTGLQTSELTIQGGWDFGTDALSSTPSFFSSRLRIINWQNDVIVKNIVIDGASGGASLEIEIDTPSTNTYNVTIENVELKNNTDNRGARIDNDKSTGSVTVNNSKFIDNANDGLWIISTGAVTLENITAVNNINAAGTAGGSGLYLDNDTGTGDVNIAGTNFFSGNYGFGLYITSQGRVALNNITVDDNKTADGARIVNNRSGATNDVTITGINSFNGNGNGSSDKGLRILSGGTITLENITADRNTGQGVYIDNRSSSSGAPVTMNGTNSARNNGLDGVLIYSDGTITLNEIIADGNGIGGLDNGATLYNYYGDGDVSITGYHNSFSNNSGEGLDIQSNGNVELHFATISNNNLAGGTDGAQLDSPGSANVYCSVFENNSGVGLDASSLSGSLTFHGMDGFTDFSYNGSAGFVDNNCKIPASPTTDGEESTLIISSLITVTGGQFVAISCVNPMTVMQMLSGDQVIFTSILCGYEAMLDAVTESDLPGALPEGDEFASGLNVTLKKDGSEVNELPVGTSMTVSFMIPAGMEGETFAIMRWDGSNWVEESVNLENGYVKAATNHTGTFVLVVN